MLAGTPLATTLFYCYFYHMAEPDDVECAPAAVRKVQHAVAPSNPLFMSCAALQGR